MGRSFHSGPMFKTLIFDLGNVLVPFDFRRGYKTLEAFCDCPAEEIPRRVSATTLAADFESGRIPPEEFHRRIAELIGLRMDYPRFCEVWNSVFLPDPLVPEETVRSLRQRYRMLLLSNTNVLHFAMLRENYPILEHFDGYILSHEVGALKPEPRIYREAVARAGCLPRECFFTDDVPAYVEGAKREGIDAVRFTGYENLKAELAARGILT